MYHAWAIKVAGVHLPDLRDLAPDTPIVGCGNVLRRRRGVLFVVDDDGRLVGPVVFSKKGPPSTLFTTRRRGPVGRATIRGML